MLIYILHANMRSIFRMRLLCCVGLVLIAGSNVHGNVIGMLNNTAKLLYSKKCLSIG